MTQPVAYPSDLPQRPLVGQTVEGSEDNIDFFTPDVGPPITNIRTNSALRPYNATLVFTGEQVASFRTWFRNTLRFGNKQFVWFLPRDENTAVIFKFMGKKMPKFQNIGPDVYRATYDLWIVRNA